MSKATSDVRKQLATELKAKKRALKELKLKDLIAISIPYTKVCKGTIRDIAKICLDKYLEDFENVSFFDEIKKTPDKYDEILLIFWSHELKIDDEKQKVVKRFSAIMRKNFVTSIGTIDWPKLVLFNVGNYALPNS